MANRIRIEIGGRLAPALLRFAREQGRDPDDVAAEALERYLRERDVETGPSLGASLGDLFGRHDDPLPPLLARMDRRFDLDEDKAMRVAVEEQHAHRAERAARRRAGG